MKLDRTKLTENEIKRLKNCEHCGGEYIHARTHPNQMYCSKPCKLKASSIKQKLRKGLKCRICGGDVPYGEYKRTCSKKCTEIYEAKKKEHKKNYSKEYDKQYRTLKPLEKRTCPICQTQFEGKGNVTYCSNPECKKEGLKRKRHEYWLTVTKPNSKKKIKVEVEDIDDIIIPEKFLNRGNISMKTGASNL